MATVRADTNSRVVSGSEVVHVRVSDGSCRLVPADDWDDRARMLAWLNAHASFMLEKPELKPIGGLEVFRTLSSRNVVERTNPGLLSNQEAVEHVRKLLASDLEKLSAIQSSHPRSGLNVLSRLLLECAPLVELPEVRLALVEALWRRESDLLTNLGQHFKRVKREERDELGYRSPASARAWRLITSARLKAPSMSVAQIAQQYAAAKDAESLQRAYRRVESEGRFPTDKAFALVLVTCLRDSSLHRGQAPEDAVPRLDLHLSAEDVKFVFPAVHVLMGGPEGGPKFILHLERIELAKEPLHEKAAIRFRAKSQGAEGTPPGKTSGPGRKG